MHLADGCVRLRQSGDEPLFQSGRLRAELRLAEVRKSSAVADYELAVPPTDTAARTERNRRQKPNPSAVGAAAHRRELHHQAVETRESRATMRGAGNQDVAARGAVSGSRKFQPVGSGEVLRMQSASHCSAWARRTRGSGGSRRMMSSASRSASACAGAGATRQRA